MEIIIKGMVCHHCIEAVERVLKSAGLTTEHHFRTCANQRKPGWCSP